jgi:hypothetical protein
MRDDDELEAGWDAVTVVLERAVASLPARAAPAVAMTTPDAGRPPFGPGTTLRVRYGPGRRAGLVQAGPGDRWLLRTLGCAGPAARRLPAPAAAAALCDRLVQAQTAVRDADNREAAALAEAGASPRLAAVTLSGQAACRLTMDVPGGRAEFVCVKGAWAFASGPDGPAWPSPLDPWPDAAGGMLIRDRGTRSALIRPAAAAIRACQGTGTRPGSRDAPEPAKPPAS